MPATFGLPFDGRPVSAAFPSLIAFHFLALALGEQAYDPRLNEMRAAVRAGESRSAWHVAESGIERKYEPVHLVGFAQCRPHAVVRVQLFGWNVWRVHFPRIVLGDEPIGLRFDLKRKTIALAKPRLTKPLVVPAD
jgi:hypothetical protein